MVDWDTIWVDTNLATMVDNGVLYGQISNGAIAIQGDRIAWVGSMDDLPGKPQNLAGEVINGVGKWVTPGLIDCHTHLVFGGTRASEFEQRLQGLSYEEIARAGGGIVSTMTSTRKASENELIATGLPRLSNLIREGCTTVEIKSGYGLEKATELKQLSVARKLGEALPVDVQTTFLGAHALPPEYNGRQGDYIEQVIEEMMPAVAKSGTADAVDAFCENIGFTASETEAVFISAQTYGLPVKIHAEQLSDMGGAALAARFGALSADHLEFISEKGVRAMAKAGTVAVILPGAFYTLRETRPPPIDLFRKYEVDIAVASDFNPGSSPLPSILLALNMCCTLFRMTPEEALAGATRNAAKALGLYEDRGTLEVGKRADLAIWKIDQPAELSYWAGYNPIHVLIHGGTAVDFDTQLVSPGLSK
ncbi:MAG: Imidazolonepropionase [Alphaproteobacteria bacterium MarineAlpha11_Bin1]|nr:MAG: Imidazolonepropionase [Alphaproteobacteria bacterium MarineAlpha11_Bin1]|tara:strand:+ start:2588 stop:3850 length:1263 start_codon:yes stop_codon:yes gene_type:complete